MDRRNEHMCLLALLSYELTSEGAAMAERSRLRAEHTDISFRTERASRNVYYLTGSEEAWETATKHVPAWDGSPSRAMALEEVARGLARGESPEVAAGWWLDSLKGAGQAMRALGISASEAARSLTRLATMVPRRGSSRGRNKRFRRDRRGTAPTS